MGVQKTSAVFGDFGSWNRFSTWQPTSGGRSRSGLCECSTGISPPHRQRSERGSSGRSGRCRNRSDGESGASPGRLPLRRLGTRPAGRGGRVGQNNRREDNLLVGNFLPGNFPQSRLPDAEDPASHCRRSYRSCADPKCDHAQPPPDSERSGTGLELARDRLVRESRAPWNRNHRPRRPHSEEPN